VHALPTSGNAGMPTQWTPGLFGRLGRPGVVHRHGRDGAQRGLGKHAGRFVVLEIWHVRLRRFARADRQSPAAQHRWGQHGALGVTIESTPTDEARQPASVPSSERTRTRNFATELNPTLLDWLALSEAAAFHAQSSGRNSVTAVRYRCSGRSIGRVNSVSWTSASHPKRRGRGRRAALRLGRRRLSGLLARRERGVGVALLHGSLASPGVRAQQSQRTAVTASRWP
jgi:hypothetical protein